MPTLTEARDRLLTENRPVLFLDTCVLIDVIRATMRRLGLPLVASAVKLRDLLRESPPVGCALVLASLVRREWEKNAPPTRDEVDKHFAVIQDQAVHFHEACQALGIPLTFSRPSYPGADLAARLFSLSEEILNLAISLSHDGECAVRAMIRVDQQRPPSQRGSEMKDCAILEECLELTRQLRHSGLAHKCVFCTSNTSDYGKPDPRLAQEFQHINLTFCTSLEWAVHEITK